MVIHRATELLFDEQSAAGLPRAITDFEQLRWDPERCRRNAERFDRQLFIRNFSEAIGRQLDARRVGRGQRRSGTEHLGLMG